MKDFFLFVIIFSEFFLFPGGGKWGGETSQSPVVKSLEGGYLKTGKRAVSLDWGQDDGCLKTERAKKVGGRGGGGGKSSKA